LNLLREGAEKLEGDEKIVLIVDALDEGGTPPNQNILGLPPVLPERVYIIVSQRPVHLTLQIETATTPRRIFHMEDNSYENREDVRKFRERGATRYIVAQALRESGYAQSQFVKTLMEKCAGVWIYLHYLVHEIAEKYRGPLNLDTLPFGLTQYYAQY